MRIRILWPRSFLRGHRLAVRTSGFQPENRGSIPRGPAILSLRTEMALYLLTYLLTPLLLLGVVLFVEQPLWLVLCVVLMLPAVYAMWTGAPPVPTPPAVMRDMFALAKIRPGERVYDLGCGDGRLVFEAKRLGAQATGFELALPVYLLAKIRSFFLGGRILFRDFWKADLSDADVVFCFLLTDSMQTFKQKLWPALKPGTRVVSHAFPMHGIEPAERMGGVRLYVKA